MRVRVGALSRAHTTTKLWVLHGEKRWLLRIMGANRIEGDKVQTESDYGE